LAKNCGEMGKPTHKYTHSEKVVCIFICYVMHNFSTFVASSVDRFPCTVVVQGIFFYYNLSLFSKCVFNR
jgi:hypothetical protein